MEKKTTQSECRLCNSTFESEMIVGEVAGVETAFQTNLCDACQEEKEEQIAKQSLGTRNERPAWEDICPKVYQGFDRDKLPEVSRSIATKVFEWQSGPRGIGLFGVSRTAKTFILHELMRRHYEAGADVYLTSSVDFAYAMGSPEQAERRAVMDRCVKAELLLLDDIGKEKITDRVESDLYRLFEQRRRDLKPIFASVNSDGETLAQAMSADGGNPIVNRLKLDLCEFLSVPKPKPDSAE